MRSIKIYKAFQTYGTYLDRFYRLHSGLEQSDFRSQLDALRKDGFPWILSWGKFNSDEKVEVFETIPNAYYLQKEWLVENNLVLGDNWKKQIVLEQVKRFHPDVFLIYPPEEYGTDFLDEIRSVVGHDVLIGGYDGMNRLCIQKYSGYDFVITCSQYISDYYLNNSKNTYPLEFGFDPDINNQIIKRQPIYPVGFTGSIFPSEHQCRYELLSYLLMRVPLTICSEYEYDHYQSLFSKQTIKEVLKGKGRTRFNSYVFGRHNHGPVYGLEMFQFLSDSAICLNMHGNNIHFAANVRLYEATGVGSCLLTDWKDNIIDLFEPDNEVVTYSCKEEALDKIRFLMKHESVRKKIAENGQKRTLNDYTYQNRINGVIEYVKSLL